ncbi:MAG TPA: MlaD family protein [Solirubrobacteraceae bacterium]|nr:MlaD family protein [Solirubrobacteraceae bacterium]
MQKRAPTLGNILVIILFVLSCFGLLLFLWESFGGPLPLKPKGYRFTVSFPRSLALAEESDVRISGVDVGHVVVLKHGGEGRTLATVELSSEYAPIRANTHAILRQKTLLGETYVQLIPEAQRGPYLGDGAQLPISQVEPSVTLDDILAAFDPRTRRAFQVWQQSVAEGIEGRGEGINSSFTQLEPFVEHANRLTSILASQEGAVHALVRNTGVVFDALASRDHQLEGLIVNGERTFHAAAESSREFAEAFEILHAFQHNSIVALKELDAFATVATPYLHEFQETQRQLSATLDAAKPFTPEFDTFQTALGPLTKAGVTGLPYLQTNLNLTVPVFENIIPVLHNLDPFLAFTGEYVREVQAFFANLTAASQGAGTDSNTNGKGPKLHYLTTMAVLSPESLAIYPNRVGTDRSNPYQHPGVLTELANALPVFSSSTCADSAPAVNGPASPTVPANIIEQIIKFGVANSPAAPNGITATPNPGNVNSVLAPPCRQQGPFSFNGLTSQFPHVVYGGK